MKTFVIAEIGINHNGNVEIAKKLIDGAIAAGASAVKFQKREIGIVYSIKELDTPRESPWGTTNREQKEGLEFSLEQYSFIDKYCKFRGIEWFFSAWDCISQIKMKDFNCKHNKVPSAMLGHTTLLELIAAEKKPTFISTGMSSYEEIASAVKIFRHYDCPFELMYCNSVYPSKPEEIFLNEIAFLREKYKCDVGYSGHETGLAVSCAAVALGATSIERHITIDRAMYGSDQAASVEIGGFIKLIRDIKAIEAAMSTNPKIVSKNELNVRKKLRYYENNSNNPSKGL